MKRRLKEILISKGVDVEAIEAELLAEARQDDNYQLTSQIAAFLKKDLEFDSLQIDDIFKIAGAAARKLSKLRKDSTIKNAISKFMFERIGDDLKELRAFEAIDLKQVKSITVRISGFQQENTSLNVSSVIK